MRLMPLLALLAGCGTTWTPVDYDGDGFSPADGDCWDSGENNGSIPSNEIKPGATDTPYDGIDQDCSEAQAGNELTDEQAHDLDYDQDGDGHVPSEYASSVTTLPADDCDDDPTTGPTVYPGAAETWYDGVDADCAGDDDFDQDGDGHASAAFGGGDDCFDAVDDTFVNDGGLDPADVYPDAEDVWYDGSDANCAGDDDFDQDGDTYTVDVDCDDLDPERYPDPSIPDEWYDGFDANCDRNDGDQDGDGYYIAGYEYEIPEGYLEGDCFDDPADAGAWGSLAPEDVSPGAAETWYDTFDQDCAGGDDFDQDADGERALDQGAGLDCDDTDAAVNTSATETWYDDVDQNCDTLNDNDQDQDGTELGDGDCDDTDATRSPAFTEDCATTYDDDCDGDTNTPNALGSNTFYTDTDGDGHGSTDSAELCVAQAPYTLTTSDDCDDTDAAVNPDVDEDCATAYDDDCDSQTNEIGADNCASWYPDSDGDDYGAGTPRCQCDATFYYPTDVGGDCNDAAAAINPGETEVCNNIDDDCVGGADDGLTLYYVDADDDSFGDETDPGDCATIGVEDNTDCDDDSSATYPAAPEMCDGVENDCDPTSVWAAGDEDGLVASVTDDGVWADLTASFDDAVATVYTMAGGRTYNFCAGTYNTRLSFSGITVDVIGVYGAANTFIDSSTSTVAKETISANAGDVYMEGLTVTGGSGAGTSPNQYGGGVYSTASTASAPTLTLKDCVIDHNTSDYGGGLAVASYAWVVLDGTTVSNNTSDVHGGGVWISTTGMLELTNASNIEDNVATGNGGGIYATGSGDIEMDASSIQGNNAPTTGSTTAGDGGGIYLTDGTLTMINGSTLLANDAGDDAGALYIDDGTATCSASSILSNDDDGNGVVYLSNFSSATATFTAATCDFGTGYLDNGPNDVTVKASSTAYTQLDGYTSDESFTCTSSSDTCTPAP